MQWHTFKREITIFLDKMNLGVMSAPIMLIRYFYLKIIISNSNLLPLGKVMNKEPCLDIVMRLENLLF